MEFIKKYRVVVGIVFVVFVLCATVIFLQGNTADEYDGLITQKEVQLTEGEKEMLKQRILVTQEAIRLKENLGEEVDLKLISDVAYDSMLLGDLVTAKEYYEKYLDLNNINPSIWQNYAGVLRDMQDFAASEDAYRQLSVVSLSESTVISLIRAIERNNPNGDRDEEILNLLLTSLETSIGRTPALLTHIARWYEDHGECQKAIEHFEVVKDMLSGQGSDVSGVIADIEHVESTCIPTE